jgi:hypothetical protein
MLLFRHSDPILHLPDMEGWTIMGQSGFLSESLSSKHNCSTSRLCNSDGLSFLGYLCL